MAGASVKGVGFMLGNMAATQEQGVKNASSGDFQKIWDSQTGTEKADSQPGDSREVAKKAPGDSLKAREEHLTRGSKMEKGMQETKPVEEMTDEELAEAMEVLGTAVMEVVQEIADAFGMSTEEVLGIMEEQGIESLDLLNPRELGELFLQISGAEDSYALITNEELYDSYQELMGKLENILQGATEELKLDEGQLGEILQRLQEKPIEHPEMPVHEPEIQVEDLRTEEEKTETAKETETTLTQTTAGEAVQESQAESGARNEGREHQPSDKGETSNLVLQNLKAEQSQPGVQQTAQTQNANFYDTETQNIMRQIMDYMRIQVKSDVSNLEMQLHPASLGTVQIQVASRGGEVTANFIAQNETVKAVLESQMVQLQESFAEQGIKVNSIEVTVQTHQFEQNLEQGRGNNRNQESGSRRGGRTRRINLNDLQGEEMLEPEDTLAADMLAAGGNTVDYTA